MLDLTKLKPQALAPNAPETESIIETHTREADAKIADTDKIIDKARPEPTVDANRKLGMSKLIDDDFPFDESQLGAIHGMKNQRYACLTGAAGTGKTTCLKKLVDELQSGVAAVDMATYWKSASQTADADDDYEAPERYVPSICLAAYTGRASQMIKRNFPRDWHGNIMTIHRMLAYMPEYYEDVDPESGNLVNKMRFIPTYNEHFKMPWDIIVLDEAGMIGLELYHQVLAAMKDGARLYLIGDINQLPPTHGKSVFGFAMAKWPSWELTHIHRQVGVNNSIVDNAWKVLKGLTPKSDELKDPNWKFAMLPIPGDANTASRYVRAWLQKVKDAKLYEPIRDSVITPINAYEQTQGYALGQDPLNRELALMFNKSDDRYIIDAGRERKYFAVGDKVMATRNDHEAGITNGMTGIITTIARNGNYSGDPRRFDTIANVNHYLADTAQDEDEETFSLDDLAGAIETEFEEKDRKEKEKSRDRGPASHIVTVRFGEGDHSFELPFATLAEVASLMTAYVVTCHKMQGGEAPLVVIILHQSHKRMLFREWLYTAITRASQRCVILYTQQALAVALSKQNIKGSTLAQKVEAFNKLTEKGIAGAAINVKIPDPESFARDLTVAAPRSISEKAKDESRREMMNLGADDFELDARRCLTCGEYSDSISTESGMCEACEVIPPPPPPPPPPPTETIRTIIIGRVIRESVEQAKTPKEREAIDLSELKRQQHEERIKQVQAEAKTKALADMHKSRLWLGMSKQLRGETQRLLPAPQKVAGLLTYNPNQTMIHMMKQLHGGAERKPDPVIPHKQAIATSKPVVSFANLNLGRK